MLNTIRIDNAEPGFLLIALEKVYAFRPDWHRNDPARPLVRQYQIALGAVLRNHRDWAAAWCAVATAGSAFSLIPAMLAAEIYSVRSAAGKSIDGKPRIDVVPSTIEPPREERTRKLATANAAVVSRLALGAANWRVLPILPHRMIPQRRIPATVNLISQSATRLPMAGSRSILRMLPQRSNSRSGESDQPTSVMSAPTSANQRGTLRDNTTMPRMVAFGRGASERSKRGEFAPAVVPADWWRAASKVGRLAGMNWSRPC